MGHEDARWLVYGANGYTGKLVAREAVRRGLKPVLAGRNQTAIRALASQHGCEARVFDLMHGPPLEQLKDVALVLNCAGPFIDTFDPMIEACLQTGSHYLDITGELPVFGKAYDDHARYAQAGIVVIPGVGYDVVPTDCLSKLLQERMPDATHLRVGFSNKVSAASRGTIRTSLRMAPQGNYERRDGQLRKVKSVAGVERMELLDGEHCLGQFSLGDLHAAHRSTGIPNITTHVGAPEQDLKEIQAMMRLGPLLRLGMLRRLLEKQAAKSGEGPDDKARAAILNQAFGTVTNAAGDSLTMRLQTPNGYTFTASVAVAAAEQVLEGTVEPGAHTPSQAFGADFVLGFDDVVLDDPAAHKSRAAE